MRAGFVVALTLLFAVSSAHAAGDAVAGKAAFENLCAACHTTVVGKNGFGPSLAGVIGRKSGTLAGYTYTPAMAHANLVWDAATLDQFLANSAAKVPGTSMPVEIADETTRANASAYLATLSGPPATAASAAPPPKAATPLPAGPTSEELLHAATDTRGWLYASKDYSGQRFVALNQITAANAHQLRAACIYRSNTTGSLQASPLVYKGTLYFTIDNVTVAIDAATCREKWTNTWELKATPLSKANRGVALADGRLVRGTPDGFLIALNMADGSLVWSQKIADPARSQYLSMPPLILATPLSTARLARTGAQRTGSGHSNLPPVSRFGSST
jgi:alcohol dehydrogenase (cytochrome c)